MFSNFKKANAPWFRNHSVALDDGLAVGPAVGPAVGLALGLAVGAGLPHMKPRLVYPECRFSHVCEVDGLLHSAALPCPGGGGGAKETLKVVMIYIRAPH